MASKLKPLNLPGASPKHLAPLSSTPAELLPLWSSSGVSAKPEVCRLCPFHTSGAGFVADWYPDEVKAPQIGFLLDFPSSDDVINQKPWSGNAGAAWEFKYLRPFGLSRADVYIGHVLRCRPKETRFGRPVYPGGKLRRDAELTCRQHDDTCWNGPVVRPGGIKVFNPTLFVYTFSPYDTIAVPALGQLLLKDIRKAVDKVAEGNRVLVVMGDEGKDLVSPWLRGAIKSWRGHWHRGSWPFGVEGSSLLDPSFEFEAA